MTVRTEIKDGLGGGRAASVTEQNALLVSVLPQSSKGVPASDLANLRQLRAYFEDGGGSNAQNVDGSTTPVEFSVSTVSGLTKWIVGFRLILEGARLEISTQDFRRYGNAATSPGLTNGVEVEAVQSGATVPITVEPVVTIGDYLQWADDFVNLINSVGTTEDYLHFDFSFDRPVVLVEGSTDRLVIRINDDLTAIDKQIAVARGYQEFL